ncbi:Argininosuccinate synthase [Methylobacterium sp. 4-46]|uniref:argininosuccinate synthase-related protein n=1 Tax=unclassified Methylobacterium TaxID=2615210 RepID=UPI000165CD6C|nr:MULTISPECIES: argininosuccinate synthase-related protein [Methylobacterium]ACA20400.1 Argininosuccinate synthase [Methylobacterium sp. 4-46]WFT79569.1 argininosuccinate synthase-related protein [Methylobacterium nodulans]
MNFISPLARSSVRVIRSFDHLTGGPTRTAPVVTMFSGGLDSSYLLHRLRGLGFAHVHAVAVDVGAPLDEPALRRAASLFGAEFVRLDGRGHFVEGHVRPAIRAHAKYLGIYPLSSSLSRPAIAELVARYARRVGADLILHTANLSQNSLPRLNNSLARLGFPGQYGSPYEQSAISRQQKAAELAEAGLGAMAERALSGDENLWCREFESGPLDDPEDFRIPEEAFHWTRGRPAPGEGAASGAGPVALAPEEIALTFERGDLVALDGRPIALIDAIAELNQRVGRFGHGRYVGLEHLSGGEKVLEVREAPAAAILMDALRHLETACVETRAIVVKQRLEQDWVQEAVSGRWGSTLHAMCGEAIRQALACVSGTVTYRVDAERFLPRAIVADAPLYIRDRDLWESREAGRACLGIPRAA